MIALLLAQAAAWAGDLPEDPWERLFPPPWERFLVNADRVVAGTVRAVRLVPHHRFPIITEIVVDVDDLLLGTVGDTVTVIMPTDGTRPGPEGTAAPQVGDAVILTMAPWLGDPSLLQLHQYVGSTVLSSGRVVAVDEFRKFIGNIDCTTSYSGVHEPTRWGPDLVPRSPWDGPDPVRIAAQEAGALDWTVVRAKTIACLRAHLEGR